MNAPSRPRRTTPEPRQCCPPHRGGWHQAALLHEEHFYHLVSKAEARPGAKPSGSLLLKEPSALEAALPSDRRSYSRSPGVTLHRPGSSCHSSQTCHFALLYSSCLAHCGAIGEDGKHWYKARKSDVAAGREQGGGRAPLLTLSRSSLLVEDNREVAIKQGFRDPVTNSSLPSLAPHRREHSPE